MKKSFNYFCTELGKYDPKSPLSKMIDFSIRVSICKLTITNQSEIVIFLAIEGAPNQTIFKKIDLHRTFIEIFLISRSFRRLFDRSF